MKQNLLKNNDSSTFFSKWQQISLIVISNLITAMGLVNIISAMFPASHRRMAFLSHYLSFHWQYGGRLTTLFFGFLFLLLATHLRRQKKAAWYITEGSLFISIIANLVKGLDIEEALLALSLFILLWPLRNHFQAKSDPILLKKLPKHALLSFLLLCLYGVLGFYFLNRHFGSNFQLPTAISNTMSSLLLFFYPGNHLNNRHAIFFINSLYLMGAAWYSYLVILIFSPVVHHQQVNQTERNSAEKIVRQYAQTVLAHYALLPDKRYFFSPAGSFIAYVVHARVALVLGDPIGPHHDLEPCLQAFLDFCQKNDWLVAFYQTCPETLSTYTQLGFKNIKIGQEGIISLTHFSLEGGQGKEFRYTLHKLEKQNYTTELILPPYSDFLVEQLSEISEIWLHLKKLKEMHFSFSSFEANYINQTPMMILRDQNKKIVAFINLILLPQKQEIYIDLMRHIDNLPNGAMDFLFIKTVLWAKEEGYQNFNLGLSALSGVGNEKTDPFIEKALNFIFQHLHVFYNFKGLHQFKKKFFPDWSPRYLIYATDLQLAQIGLAILQASQ